MEKEIFYINPTPVKTARNFKLNNLEYELNPMNIKMFRNITVISPETDLFDIKDVFIGVARECLNTRIQLRVYKNYGMTVFIPKGTKLTHPIVIKTMLDSANRALIENLKLVVERNSEVTLVIYYETKKDLECFHYLRQQIAVGTNSKLKIVLINLVNNNTDSFLAMEADVRKNASIEYRLLDLGGRYKVSNYYAHLKGDGSRSDFKNIYIGGKDETIDMNYKTDTIGENTVARIDTQGVLTANARKSYKATIDFKEGSKKSDGKENENCILLSDEAVSRSLPMLLCHEEDVYGEHGVSTGKISEDKLFYMMSKGISEKEAKKLTVKANFQDVLKDVEEYDYDGLIEKKVEEFLNTID